MWMKTPYLFAFLRVKVWAGESLATIEFLFLLRKTLLYNLQYCMSSTFHSEEQKITLKEREPKGLLMPIQYLDRT